jgi:uncharacterized integral membrane protein
MKTKELGWKETQGIQNIGIEDAQGNRIVDKKQVMKNWENYVTELYNIIIIIIIIIIIVTTATTTMVLMRVGLFCKDCVDNSK